MFRHTRFMIVSCGLCISVLLGCQTTEKVTRRSQLENAKDTGPITVITHDSTVFVFNNYWLTDSAVHGQGDREKNGKKEQFAVDLPFSRIAYIQASHSDGFKQVLALAAIGFIGGTALSYLSGEGGGVQVWPVEQYIPPYSGGGGGGGSCPFVYGWNGSEYVLQGEAYGVGWGKALEMNTCIVLPALRADRGTLKLQMTNERPETHYYNSVQLRAAETDLKAEILSDNANNLWPIYSPVPPVRATDHSHNVVTATVAAADGSVWESDLANTGPLSTFEDVLELSFPREHTRNSGTLIIRAVNTQIIGSVLSNVFGLLGDQSLQFVRALEQDGELIGILKNWIEEASLKVSLWNGTEWRHIASITPEASAIAFAKGVRISLEDNVQDTIKIRLTCLADVWKIDATLVDWTPVSRLATQEVPLISAIGPRGKDVSATLESSDTEYLVLIPPEKIDLTYKSMKPSPGKKVVYAVDVQGYLHEWIPPKSGTAALLPAGWLDGTARIEYLKKILRLKDVFLPPVYSEWKQTRRSAEASR